MIRGEMSSRPLVPRRKWPRASLIAGLFMGLFAGATELIYYGVRLYFYRAIEPAVLPPREPVRPLANLRASTCASCHSVIHGEWLSSAHGRAMTDEFFVAEYTAEHRLFACLRCHAPLSEQQPTIVTGFLALGPPVPRERSNPRYDSALGAEGVTCVVCHQQDGEIVGPVDLGPDLGVVNASHATRVDPSFGGNGLCVRCHAAERFPGTSLQREPLATFTEHQAWRAAGGTLGCVQCHYPEVTRALTASSPPRAGRAHTLMGPRDRDFVRAHLAIEPPRCALVGQGMRCVLGLTNGAGHRMPTGEPGRDLAVLWQPGAGPRGELHIARRMDRIRLTELRGEDTTLLPRERREVVVLGGPGPGELSVRFCLFLPGDPLLAATGRPYERGCQTLARWSVDLVGRVIEESLPGER